MVGKESRDWILVLDIGDTLGWAILLLSRVVGRSLIDDTPEIILRLMRSCINVALPY
ncbi:protein of unknown function [Limnospira indica PCC 8005]|uniref:Uncharacterized protein n=1 Tax=Limnospira indica PCC 8005 TaxID=376219 RepID=A0A9P1KDQ7_9CYAN|nr:protein of unknown function [Limnospira indica PCC 8005]